MNKKFLLSSLFLVFTVIASAEVQADKEILEMLGKELDKLPIEELRYVDSEILKELLLAAELREVDKKILEELGEVDKLPVEKLGQTDKKILQELPDSSLLRCLVRHLRSAGCYVLACIRGKSFIMKSCLI